jgi:hypothetical protein
MLQVPIPKPFGALARGIGAADTRTVRWAMAGLQDD